MTSPNSTTPATSSTFHGLDRAGLLASLCAYVIWGFLPLYLHALQGVKPEMLLAQRILWAIPWAAGLMWLMGQGPATWNLLANPIALRNFAISASLIGINWLTYFYAVFHHRVMEASLGYFLNPLMNVMLGVMLLGERLSKGQMAAAGLAALGTIFVGVASGAPPWLGLILCVTFGFYGLVRKVTPAPAAGGLLIETVILAPLAAFAMYWMTQHGTPAFTPDTGTNVLIALSGPATAIPLILFAIGARKLPLSVMGLLQYLAPSIQFGLSIAFDEPFTMLHAEGFALIWLGLGVFAWDRLRTQPSAS